MFFYILYILLGIIGLGIGAELIVKGSVNLSRIYKWSGYFVGFTIVALGTSLPEFAASVQAIHLDSIPIAIGNIIGSNVANILLVLGAVGIVSPIIFPKPDQSAAMLIVTFLICIVVWLSIRNNFDSVTMGIIFIFLSLAYLFWQYRFSIDEQHSIEHKSHSQLKAYFFIFSGFILVFFGSESFILGSKNIALSIGVSEAVIGLTLVALGTSLPELVTGIVAALKKQSGLAVGTILGSNIYNIAAILGIVFFIFGYQDGELNNILPDDLQKKQIGINATIMALVTLLFVSRIKFGFSFIKMEKHRIGVKTGIIFILLYLIYTYYNYYYLN